MGNAWALVETERLEAALESATRNRGPGRAPAASAAQAGASHGASQTGAPQVTPEGEFEGTAEAKAIMSVLDVVEELANGIRWGQVPDDAWLEVLRETFQAHRDELRGVKP
jgi:hypothetical protein